ncbi:cytochrome P450 [Paenibacillus elgii]|uniref:cytochrome P450 n=1 Tax=Paenibacillus elgii TaxID=189691 RepID=UPI0016726ED6|nr:cytochrome P450 [Paenibacillus elgii]
MTNEAPNLEKVFLPLPENDLSSSFLNPFPTLNRLRQTTPIRYDEARQCWDIFGYQEIQHILKAPECFSSVIPGKFENSLSLPESILELDPPQHTKLRKIAGKAFAPAALSQLEAKIAAIANELIDRVARQGEMDFVADFANPLPVIVISEMLGVEQNDRALFKHWSDTMVKSPADASPESLERLYTEQLQARRELEAYFRQVIELRRTDPQEDLISQIVHTEVDGEKLTFNQIVEFCILLLVAGNETTTNLLGNFVRLLTERSELQPAVYGNPERLKTMIEETLRFYSPVQALLRYAKQDTDIQGCHLKKDDVLVLWLASANRDPAVFDRPDELDIDRSPNPHVAFGFGIHFCLGAMLSRMEAQIALDIATKRLHGIRLAPCAALAPIPNAFFFGLQTLPIEFDPEHGL